MYKKFLLGSLTALLPIALSSGNLALGFSNANSVSNSVTLGECKALNSSKLDRKFNLSTDFNFANYLSIKVTGSGIVAQFAPLDNRNKPIELSNLATAKGYQSFNWVNYVEQDPYGITDLRGNLLSLPYNDPPVGGYVYGGADRYPYYWDIEKCQNCHSRHYHLHPKIQQSHTLTFEDHPSDYRLQPGEAIEFVTHLVGVKTDGTNPKHSQWEVLSTFRWQLTNDAAGKGQVSLIAINQTIAELSPSLLTQMQDDGGVIPLQETQTTYQNRYSFDSHQCQLQSHQNQHRDSHR